MQPTKLARLLFDFGVISTTADNCVQQVLSVAIRLQRLTTLPARWLSSSVYNGWPHCQQDDCQAPFTTADHIASKMTVKLGLQQLTTLPARWLSSSVYNSWPHCQQDGCQAPFTTADHIASKMARFTTAVVWRQVKQDTHTFCIRNQNISPRECPGRSQCGNRITAMPTS